MHTEKETQLKKELSHSSTFDTSNLAMERGVILLIAVLMIYVTPAVHGMSHLTFSNDTTEVSITRDGCGTEKLCIETPDNCDPAMTSPECLFTSLVVTEQGAPNGNDLRIGLSGMINGNAAGYIAVGLTADPSEGITLIFACVRYNGTVKFMTAERNNTANTISSSERTVNEIRSRLDESLIQCIFDVPGLNTTETTRADNFMLNVLLGTGTFNATTGLDPFMVKLDSDSLNILDPNATPTVSTVSITRDGCGTEKLCIETPDNCDPAMTSPECLFTSLVVTEQRAPNGNDLRIELSGMINGNASGYIAVGLTADPSEGITLIFACVRYNGTVKLMTAERNNTANTVSSSERTVNEIRSRLDESLIQCRFKVPGLNTTETTRAGNFMLNVLLGTGTFNATTGLGSFMVKLDSGSLNILDPNATSSVTTVNPTTDSCGTVHPHAVLLLLSVLSLSIVLGA